MPEVAVSANHETYERPSVESLTRLHECLTMTDSHRSRSLGSYPIEPLPVRFALNKTESMPMSWTDGIGLVTTTTVVKDLLKMADGIKKKHVEQKRGTGQNISDFATDLTDTIAKASDLTSKLSTEGIIHFSRQKVFLLYLGLYLRWFNRPIGVVSPETPIDSWEKSGIKFKLGKTEGIGAWRDTNAETNQEVFLDLVSVLDAVGAMLNCTDKDPSKKIFVDDGKTNIFNVAIFEIYLAHEGTFDPMSTRRKVEMPDIKCDALTPEKLRVTQSPYWHEFFALGDDYEDSVHKFMTKAYRKSTIDSDGLTENFNIAAIYSAVVGMVDDRTVMYDRGELKRLETFFYQRESDDTVKQNEASKDWGGTDATVSSSFLSNMENATKAADAKARQWLESATRQYTTSLSRMDNFYATIKQIFEEMYATDKLFVTQI